MARFCLRGYLTVVPRSGPVGMLGLPGCHRIVRASRRSTGLAWKEVSLALAWI